MSSDDSFGNASLLDEILANLVEPSSIGKATSREEYPI